MKTTANTQFGKGMGKINTSILGMEEQIGTAFFGEQLASSIKIRTSVSFEPEFPHIGISPMEIHIVEEIDTLTTLFIIA